MTCSWGPCCVFDPYVVLRVWGRFRWRGELRFPRCHGPLERPPESAGRPMGPPPRFDVSIHCLSLSPYECAVIGPSSFAFCLDYLSFPPFFLSVSLFLRRRRSLFFCSLFLSGAGVWGSPNVAPATLIIHTYTIFLDFANQVPLGFVVVVDRAQCLFFSLSLSLSIYLFLLERQKSG